MGVRVTDAVISSARDAAREDGRITAAERSEIDALSSRRSSQDAFGEKWSHAHKMSNARSAASLAIMGAGLVAGAAVGSMGGMIGGALFACAGLFGGVIVADRLVEQPWRESLREQGATLYATQGRKVAKERLEALRF